jgi:hypothetical protein
LDQFLIGFAHLHQVSERPLVMPGVVLAVRKLRRLIVMANCIMSNHESLN